MGQCQHTQCSPRRYNVSWIICQTKGIKQSYPFLTVIGSRIFGDFVLWVHYIFTTQRTPSPFSQVFLGLFGYGGSNFSATTRSHQKSSGIGFCIPQTLYPKMGSECRFYQAGLIAAINRAVNQITPQTIENWVKKCGYINEPDATREIGSRLAPSLRCEPPTCDTADQDLHCSKRIKNKINENQVNCLNRNFIKQNVYD